MQNGFCNIAVLISGGGSNLQSIIDHVCRGHINANITCVISNNPDAFNLFTLRSFGESFYHHITDAALEFGYVGV